MYVNKEGRSKHFFRFKREIVYPLFFHSPWSDGLPGPYPRLFQILWFGSFLVEFLYSN